MIKSINETLNTGKKKVLAFVLSGALILTLGTGVAYAVNSIVATAKADNGNGIIITDIETRAVSDDDGVGVKGVITAKAKADNGNGTISEDIEIRTLSDEDGVSVRAIARANEDGTFSYSTDGGKTWSNKVPAGLDGFSFSVDPDGNGASGKLGN